MIYLMTGITRHLYAFDINVIDTRNLDKSATREAEQGVVWVYQNSLSPQYGNKWYASRQSKSVLGIPVKNPKLFKFAEQGGDYLDIGDAEYGTEWKIGGMTQGPDDHLRVAISTEHYVWQGMATYDLELNYVGHKLFGYTGSGAYGPQSLSCMDWYDGSYWGVDWSDDPAPDHLWRWDADGNVQNHWKINGYLANGIEFRGDRMFLTRSGSITYEDLGPPVGIIPIETGAYLGVYDVNDILSAGPDDYLTEMGGKNYHYDADGSVPHAEDITFKDFELWTGQGGQLNRLDTGPIATDGYMPTTTQWAGYGSSNEWKNTFNWIDGHLPWDGANIILDGNNEKRLVDYSATVGNVSVGLNKDANSGVFVIGDGGTLNVGESLSIGIGFGGHTALEATGVLNVTDNTMVGISSPATFIQSDSSQHTVGNRLQIGINSGIQGNYTQNNGTLQATSEDVGVYGTGIFYQHGGQNTVSSDITLGYYSGGQGTYNQTGGTLQAGNEWIGREGTGTFTQTGGPHTVAGTLTFGLYSTGSGTYNLHYGDLSADSEDIGHDGTGAFLQTGGSNNITNNLYLGYWYDSNGTYALSGSGHLSANVEYVGYYGAGIFTQAGGTHEANHLHMGQNSGGGSGEYNLNGGTLNVYGNSRVGESGNAYFLHDNGTHNTNELTVGNWGEADGSYTLNDGTLNVSTNTILGNHGTGAFTQAGGHHTAQNLYLGYEDGSGTYNISGGTLDVNGTIEVGVGSEISLNGVSVTTNTYTQEAGGSLQIITVGSGYGKLAVSGILNLAGTLMVIWEGSPPSAGDVYDILDWDVLSGEFDTINLPDLVLPSLSWDISNLYVDGTISVKHTDLAPTAAFTWSPEPQAEGSSIEFTDESTSSPDEIVSWSWDFGGLGTSTEQNPSFTFMDDGSYTVTLTVTDDDESTNTVSHNVTVTDLGPTAAFTWSPEPQDEGVPVQFTDESTSSPDEIASWSWDFGGLGTSANQNPSFTFMDNGSYNVTLTVTDDDGSTDTVSHSVTVNNVAPTVDAGSAATVNEGDTFTSSGSFTDPGSDTWTATVNYGDSTGPQPLALTGKNFSLSHVYADNSTYTVTVTVTDDDGASTLDTLTVTVLNVAPTLYAGADQFVYEDDVISLEPSTFNDLGTLDTHEATIDWGDGTPVEAGIVAESPFGPPGLTAGADGTVSGSHAYTHYGLYTVTVEVTDDDDAIVSDTFKVTVWPAVFKYALFGNEDKLSIKEKALISGDVFNRGDVDIKKDAVIDGLLFCTGKVKGKGSYTLGELPEPLPDFPVLDTTPYDTLLLDASSQPKGKKKVFKDLNLDSGTLLVNGDFELKAKGSLTGPGTVVATKDISIKKESILIGEDITLIAGEKLEIKESVTSPDSFGHIFFSRKEINIKEKSQISGALVCLGKVEIKEETVFNGIVYATGEAKVKEKSIVVGSVVANKLKEVKEETSVTYEAGLVQELITKVFIEGTVATEPILAAPALANAPQDKASLEQNYPNPFNPETWIPYTLTEGASVIIQLYNVAGKLVRTLDLGYKDAGYYLERKKAAYWDGRNELGEQVASGVYFYVMKAGKFTATRKMVITQ